MVSPPARTFLSDGLFNVVVDLNHPFLQDLPHFRQDLVLCLSNEVHPLRAGTASFGVPKVFSPQVEPGRSAILLKSLDGIAPGAHKPSNDAIGVGADCPTLLLGALAGEHPFRFGPGSKASLHSPHSSDVLLKLHIALPLRTIFQHEDLFCWTKCIYAGVHKVFVWQRVNEDLPVGQRRFHLRPIRHRQLVDVDDDSFGLDSPPVPVTITIPIAVTISTSRPSAATSASGGSASPILLSVPALCIFSTFPLAL